ncbi:MAG: hypothetical protein ACE5SW_02530 [Nitrososphaeraceae archaeon]
MRTDNKNKKMIIIDIDVSNCQIRALKANIQTLMPDDKVGKSLFWNTVELERLHKRQIGGLKGKGLKKVEEIVNRYGSITTNGLYGSIEIVENDFIPFDKEE